MALALSLGVLAAAPATAAEAAVSATSGTLEATPTRAIAGEPVRLAGKVPPRRSRPVALQRLKGSTWSTVASSRTTARGRYSFTTATPAGTTRFRVVARKKTVAGMTLKKVTTPIVTVTALAQSASLSLPGTASRGSSVTAAATFAPARPGRPVVLQRLSGGSWLDTVTGVQSATGEVGLAVPTDAVGTETYRVLTASYGGAAEAVSSSASFTVAGPPTPPPTTPVDTTPPSVPTGLTATAWDAEVQLDWDDVMADDLVGYVVHRATSATGPWTRLVSTPLDVPGYTATGLTNGTTYWFAVSAVDETGNESSRSAAASATPVGPLAVATTSLPAATQGSPYSKQLLTSGGTTPITWTLTSGTLPAGLTLGTAGMISGTPTDAGTSAFTVRATDASSAQADGQLTLTVDAPASPVISESALPDGQVGVGYAYRPTLLGPSSGTTWSVTSGALPSGLTLDPATGLVAGVPTATSTSSFTLRALNPSGTATKALTLEVAAASGWAQPGADQSRSGYVVGEHTIDAAHVSRVGVEWSPDDAVNATAVADGKLFSGGPIPGTGWQGLTVRDLASGEVLWSTPFRVGFGNSYACAQVAVTADLVLCVNSRVVAISRSTHEIVWDTQDTDPGSYAADVAVAGGYVVVGGTNGTDWGIAAYRLATGEFLWRRLTTGSVAGLAVASDRVVAVVEAGSSDKLRTFALTDTGTAGWTADLADASRTRITVAGGIVVTAQGTAVVFRSVSDGSVTRTFTSPRPLWGPLGHDEAHVYAATATFDDFGSASDTGVTAIGLADGLEKWHVDTTVPLRAGMAVGGGILWVHASDLLSQRTPSELLAVDTSDGTVLRTFVEPDTSSLSPVVGGGRVLVQTHEGLDVMGVMAPRIRVPLAPLPTGWTDQPYAASLAAVGGTGARTWSVAGGALPPGLSLSAAGALSGKPTAPGTYDVTVRVRDEAGMTGTRELTIGVRTASTTTSWVTGSGRADRDAVSLGESGITADTTSTFAVRWASAPSTGSTWVTPGTYGEEPLVVGNRVFGVRGDGSLAAFDTSTNGTGKAPLWTVGGTPAFVGTPTLVGGETSGTLYLLDTSGVLHAVAVATHADAWSVDPTGSFGGATHASPTVVGSKVVVAMDGTLVAIDTTTHSEAWTASVPGLSSSYGVSTDGTRLYVYAGCSVTARLVSTGAEVWTREISGGFGQCGGVTGFGSIVRAAPVVLDGTVYGAGAYDGAVAIDAAGGTVLWRTNGQVLPPSVVTERWVVLEYAFNDEIALLDRRTGQVVHDVPLPFHPTSSATLAGDVVLYQGKDGRVHGLDLLTLDPVWQSPALGATPTSASVAVARGRVWSYTGDLRIVGIGGP